jgi:flagellar biosynthetic protein FliQ
VIGNVATTEVHQDLCNSFEIASHHASPITHHEVFMTPEMVTELGRQALETTLLVSAPFLGLSLVVGLAVSALQAMTQLNEATLTFVPKVLTIFGAIVVFMPWVLGVMTTFMTELFSNIPNYVH